MECQIWYQPASSDVLWREGSEGQWPLPTFLSGKKLCLSSHLCARYFNSSLYATSAFQATTPVLDFRGISMCKSMCGFIKRNCLGLQKFLPLTPSPLVFAARSYGNLSSWHWKHGLGGLVWGWESSLLRYPSWIFIHLTWMWNQTVPQLHPSYQSGWKWFL